MQCSPQSSSIFNDTTQTLLYHTSPYTLHRISLAAISSPQQTVRVRPLTGGRYSETSAPHVLHMTPGPGHLRCRYNYYGEEARRQAGGDTAQRSISEDELPLPSQLAFGGRRGRGSACGDFSFASLLQAALAALSATPSQPQLCRFYVRTLRTISKRLVLRM